ncbi:hypothetical protein KY328_04705 [Candidatus Woesearchaeota archaeon]|nr:hypothetical protein [Candidatus Woesearchaeota archaeon]MBW3022198.1 hypothetical protein [Candidatus Woesearchaeota archaeon]
MVTAIQIRDKIIERMFQGGKEYLKRIEGFYNMKSQQEIDVLKQKEVESVVAATFEKVNADFENPTKESLLLVIEELHRIGPKYAPKDVVEKDAKDFKKLVQGLE